MNLFMMPLYFLIAALSIDYVYREYQQKCEDTWSQENPEKPSKLYPTSSSVSSFSFDIREPAFGCLSFISVIGLQYLQWNKIRECQIKHPNPFHKLQYPIFHVCWKEN